MDRIIFHVDVNSAFLSWEAARRLEEKKLSLEGVQSASAEEPDLRSVASIIGGDPSKRTSIVLAKSVPAKKYGIITGEPVSSALRKCPELVVAPSDFRLYSRMSRAFKAICREYSPAVEEFSIDECFLDMSGMQRIFPDPIQAALELKDRINKELGFTVNIGLAPNKLLAKMASDFKKPDRVHTLFEDEIADKMWPLPVGELFFCGKASVSKLKRVQINTIGDLAKADRIAIRSVLGNKLGNQLWSFANGIDDSPVSSTHEEPKGYSNEITFDDNITTWERGNNVLLHIADSVAARLRADEVKAYCVSVTIRGNDMKKHSRQKKLSKATDSTSQVFEIAEELFAERWDGKTPLRLIGISLNDLERDNESIQISLFDDALANEEKRAKYEKDRNADKAVDALRSKFGNDIIKRGGMIDSDVKVRKMR